MTETPFPFDPFALIADSRKRLGLDEDDARRAMEALMPAFWAGLRRSSDSPLGADAMMRAFFPALSGAGGVPAPGMPWPTSWPAAARPGGPDWTAAWLGGGAPDGPVGAFLQQIFPNEAIRRAVLDQVAASTGISREALAGLMPVAATLMMGQMARNFAVGPARDLLDAFMAGYARGRPRPAPTPADMMAPFAAAMSAFFTGFARADGARVAPEEGARPSGDTPRKKSAPDEAVGGDADPHDAGAEAAAPSGRSSTPIDDFLSAGRSIQEGQIRAFEQLFDTLVPDTRG